MVSHVNNGGDGVYDISLSSSPENEQLSPKDQKVSSVANDALKDFNIEDECTQITIRKGISECLLEIHKEDIDREKIKNWSPILKIRLAKWSITMATTRGLEGQ